MQKSQVNNILNELPDTFQLEQIIDKLVFINKVEIGIEQLDKEQVFTHKEVENTINKWFVNEL